MWVSVFAPGLGVALRLIVISGQHGETREEQTALEPSLPTSNQNGRAAGRAIGDGCLSPQPSVACREMSTMGRRVHLRSHPLSNLHLRSAAAAAPVANAAKADAWGLGHTRVACSWIQKSATGSKERERERSLTWQASLDARAPPFRHTHSLRPTRSRTLAVRPKAPQR